MNDKNFQEQVFKEVVYVTISNAKLQLHIKIFAACGKKNEIYDYK